MIKQGKMTKHGLEKVKAAKKNGEWYKTAEAVKEFEMPSELTNLLSFNKKAREFFNELSPSNKKLFIGWIASAKKVETREKRAGEALNLLNKKQKLGMK
jgi:uncharacterized protein YdeI (YjbR/CyaY-like superfamily)